MAVFRVTVKTAKNSNGVRIEKGMTVDVVTNSMMNPVITDGGKSVIESFNRIYGIDIKKAGVLSMAYLDVQKIG